MLGHIWSPAAMMVVRQWSVLIVVSLVGIPSPREEKGLDESKTLDQTQQGQNPGCWPPSPEPFPQQAAAVFDITQRTRPDCPKGPLRPELTVPEIPPLEIISFGGKGCWRLFGLQGAPVDGENPRDKSSAQLMSAGSQEDELADRQPRVRCRGKEEILAEGWRNVGSTEAGSRMGAVSALERVTQLWEPWAGDSGSLVSPPTCCVVPGKSLSYSELWSGSALWNRLMSGFILKLSVSGSWHSLTQ